VWCGVCVCVVTVVGSQQQVCGWQGRLEAFVCCSARCSARVRREEASTMPPAKFDFTQRARSRRRHDIATGMSGIERTRNEHMR